MATPAKKKSTRIRKAKEAIAKIREAQRLLEQADCEHRANSLDHEIDMIWQTSELSDPTHK